VEAEVAVLVAAAAVAAEAEAAEAAEEGCKSSCGRKRAVR
jgi:hypothetical protein